MPDKTLLGEEQLSWLKARVEASKSAGTRWQLIGQQTVVLDSAHADVDEAIAAKSRTDINVSNLWAWQLHNVTGWDCSTPVICGSGSEHIKSYISLDPTAYRAQDYNKRKDVRTLPVPNLLALNTKPSTLNTKPSTSNTKPSALNTKPEKGREDLASSDSDALLIDNHLH